MRIVVEIVVVGSHYVTYFSHIVVMRRAWFVHHHVSIKGPPELCMGGRPCDCSSLTYKQRQRPATSIASRCIYLGRDIDATVGLFFRCRRALLLILSRWSSTL